MQERVCCKILGQIPLIKYSKLGVIVRIQASKCVPDDDDNIDLVFDVYIDGLVPTKSNSFFDISVNDGRGDLVLLTSEKCCVIAEIPWSKRIVSTKLTSRRSSSIGNKVDLGSNPAGRGQRVMNVKRPSHTYGYFEDEDDNNQELINDMSTGINNSHKILIGNSEKDLIFEIPTVTGIIILNLSTLSSDNGQISDRNTSSLIIKSSWYRLDDCVVFILAKIKNSTKLIALDLISIVYQDHNKDLKDSNIDQFDTDISGGLGDLLKSFDNNISYNDKVHVCNLFDLSFSDEIIGYNTRKDKGTGIIKYDNPVDFTFGRGPDVWNMLSVYVLFDDNRILSLCPVVINRMRLPYFAYEALYSALLEQEYLYSSTEEVLEKEFQYDKSLHGTLSVLLGELRNPIDGSNNIIEQELHVDISREAFMLISRALKPVPVQLSINWNCQDSTPIKSMRLCSVTNYPLSVFLIFGSNMEIGVFISSYLSMPNFKDTRNCNAIQDIEQTSFKNLGIDLDGYFNFKLECIQRSKIPASYSEESKEEAYPNFRFLLGSQPDPLDDPQIRNTQDGITNYEIPLFIVGAATENNIHIIYIDWLHYLFTLYSTIESETHKNNDKNRVLPISDNIEIVRKCINSENKLNIHNINPNSNANPLTDLHNTHITCIPKYDNNLNRNTISIEFIYMQSGANQEKKNSKHGHLLVNPDYDELPEEDSRLLYNTESTRRDFNISDFIDKDFINKQTSKSDVIKETTQLDYQVNKLNEYALESILQDLNNFTNQFQLIKDKNKPINNEQDASQYYLRSLRFLNDFNSKILVKLNNLAGPVLNLVDNIPHRINLMKELKEDISKTNEGIKEKESEIQHKINNTLDNNKEIHQRIARIKNLFLQELNNQRLQYNQDVILPEILVMLSNVQLELCSTIINIVDNGTNQDVCINDLDGFDQSKSNILNYELNSYLAHNKSVMENFQNLQNKVLELNRMVCNFSNQELNR
ncbi:hypothetical protein OJ252_2487 [Cryptosporidium canis]|uniref:Uncharacterized protein n=1 Tax=Cryptosporidium canis TaxID=195482 RepID=A0ABQ8P5D8_9CRYT|nr:hypothetical protein OJ252_2487 [Cryptosporidium canis]